MLQYHHTFRASASRNAISSHFTIPKSYFINYTIPFYNTHNIPKFYFFPILFKYSILFILFSLISHLSFPVLSFSLFSIPLSHILHGIEHHALDRSSRRIGAHTFSITLSHIRTQLRQPGRWVQSFVSKSPMSSLRCKVQKPNVDFGLSLPLSLCRSPMLGAARANLLVVCRAFAMEPIFPWRAVGADWVCLDQQVADVVVLLWGLWCGFSVGVTVVVMF